MKTAAIIMMNEVMAFVTLIVVFPGFLPPKNRMEWLLTILMFVPMSVAWPLFLILFPFVYIGLLWAGKLETFNPYFQSWPFR